MENIFHFLLRWTGTHFGRSQGKVYPFQQSLLMNKNRMKEREREGGGKEREGRKKENLLKNASNIFQSCQPSIIFYLPPNRFFKI